MDAPGNPPAAECASSETSLEALGADIVASLRRCGDRLLVARGDYLIREGDRADALFIVEIGRFDVLRSGSAAIIAEIGPGSMVGEIAFFADGTRTSHVRARRDSVVTRIAREDFELACAMEPGLLHLVSQTLARRLAVTTSRVSATPSAPPKPVTICIVQAGAAPIPDWFINAVRQQAITRSRCAFLDDSRINRAFGGDPITGAIDEPIAWFNDLETRYDSIIFAADATLTAWSQKALRQADEVLIVGDHGRTGNGTGRDLNEVERRAFELTDPGRVRLVLLHPAGTADAVEGSGDWLDQRPKVVMHHHVEEGSQDDLARLFRFVDREAVGLVASGGGAFTAGHIGLYQAICETGVSIDIFGGTSGGAAMAAAFALGVPPAEIDRQTRWMFVERKAMRLWTWPRYSLLDHSMMDYCLNELFGARDIADMRIPWFAVASSLKDGTAKVLRRGPLWKAIRASAAIPALLPPVFTDDGDTLVDGCLLDNVPLGPMRALKGGPNIIFEHRPELIDAAHVVPEVLPSRWELLRDSVRPKPRSEKEALAHVPGPHAILLQALMIHQGGDGELPESGDLVLAPTVPRQIGVLDWHRHMDLRWAAYDFARDKLSAARQAGHRLLQS